MTKNSRDINKVTACQASSRRTNIFMCDFKEKRVITSQNRPSVWCGYVDDAFALFDDSKSGSLVLPYRSSRERLNSFFFLDILVKRCSVNAFLTSIYQKEKPKQAKQTSLYHSKERFDHFVTLFRFVEEPDL